MLPAIRNRACFAFRKLGPEARDEAMQQVVVSTFIAFGRLIEQNRAHLASPSALTRFAIAQECVGRRIDAPLNSNEVLSPYAQRRRGFHVQRLNRSDSNGQWRDVLVEDRQARPAELALTWIDFEDWLRTLTPRQQTVAYRLAEGHTVTDISIQLQVSVGRVSQIRRELARSWDEFHGAADSP